MEIITKKADQFVQYLTEHRNCIICENLHTEVWIDYGYTSLVKCGKCGLIWADPYINRDGQQKYYVGYNYNDSRSDGVATHKREEQYRLDKKNLMPFISKKRKVKIFDIGCAHGDFLDVFGSGRFVKYGFDIDTSIDTADNNMFYGEFKDLPKTFNKFDVVVLRGVIQHLSDPDEYFKKISEITCNGSLLYMCAVPNVSSFCSIMFKEKWNLFDPMAYMFHFDDKTLEKYLNKYGFELVDKNFPYVDTPYCDLVRDYEKVKEMIETKNVKGDISPAFWGNLMNLTFKKV